MIEDEIKIAILKFVKEHPSTSARQIASHLSKRKICAKDTTYKRIKQLEGEGYLDVFRTEIQGKKFEHRLTNKGINALLVNPIALPVKRGLIKLSFSTEILKNIGREPAEKFLKLMENPEEEKKIGNIIGNLISYYASTIEKEAYTVEYFPSLKKHLFMGSLPQEVSEKINWTIKNGLFNNPLKAFSHILELGLIAFKTAIRSEKPGSGKLTLILMATKYDQKKGTFVPAISEMKQEFQKMSPEHVKQIVLQSFNK
jgi:DNA-binding Lrp family transcriptional regulator